jgi:perosamine synthetase
MPDVTCGPFPWPIADDQVLAALEKAYHDGSWGVYHGPDCAALADELCEYFSCEQAQLCSSGTISVELALRGCGVEPGDEVILAGYDFPGNFRAIDAIGARPVLVDVARDSWSLDVESLEEVRGERVKAVVVSHLHGGLADMEQIMAIARQRGWKVVEDACQQPGAELAGRKVGTWGDVGVLSFGGSKLLTAGRGGAVLTDDAAIRQRMKVYSEQGNQAFPLSELQAAVLRPQLAKLDQSNAIRRDRVSLLREATRELSDYLRPVASRPNSQPTYYKHAWSLVPAESDPELRQRFVATVQAAGAPIDAGFRGFSNRGERRCEKPVPLPASTALSQSTLLLHHPLLLAHEKAAHQLAEVLIHSVQQLAY